MVTQGNLLVAMNSCQIKELAPSISGAEIAAPLLPFKLPFWLYSQGYRVLPELVAYAFLRRQWNTTFAPETMVYVNCLKGELDGALKLPEMQNSGEHQAVKPAGNGHQHTISTTEHGVIVHGSADLTI